MKNNEQTEHEKKLTAALRARGVDFIIHHNDGHKHVDIYIPKDKIYIEVDGIPHTTRPEKIITDFNRDYFSFKEGFSQNI